MTSIKPALDDLLNTRDLTLEEAVRRHFAPEYRQRTDGSWDGYDGFLDHMRHLRSIVDKADVEVLDELIDGRFYADRHVVTILKKNGGRVVQEVYLFAEFAEDGRFARIEESTMMLTGAEDDRAIGSAR